ncbi:hypothetical protein [Ralstonia phage RP31]|uniref:Uncharacterized protein n=2 Tax=Ripduovirus RP12 TaxID=2560700 RepID=A0A1L7N112_9CAUD|nr:hypothetical protein FDH28_gp226 [Ralstonia phage RP12]BAW19169.1 hypothetical protein [Ralstonia phage RP12]BAW19455.1 hypothetical protein [Ralstonia phage RP31]
MLALDQLNPKNIMDKQKYKRLLQLGIVGGVALAVAPAIFLIIKGIVGLAIAAVVGGAVLALQPAVTTWLTNMKFKAVTAVVQANPIETLYTRQQERTQELETARVKLEGQATSLEKFRKKVAKLVQDYPEEARTYQDQLSDFERLLAYRVDQFKDAKTSLEVFKRNVVKAKDLYEMSLAAVETGAAMNAGEDFMSKFKEEVAFDEVDNTNAKAIAQLRMALADDNYVRDQIKGQEVRAINYTAEGGVILGNILKPIENVKVIA